MKPTYTYLLPLVIFECDDEGFESAFPDMHLIEATDARHLTIKCGMKQADILGFFHVSAIEYKA